MNARADRLHVPASPPGMFRAGGIICRMADYEDDHRLRALLRGNEMDAWINLSFEREPSFFAGTDLIGESTAVIACDEREQLAPVGMYTCSFFPTHLNGHPTRTGYLGGLRVDQKYRRKIRILRSGFASIPALHSDRPPPACWFTSVAVENNNARRILEAGLAGLPKYRSIGPMETLAFSTRQGKFRGLLQPATRADVPALCNFFNRHATAFQFSPVLAEAWLLSLDGSHGLELQDFHLLKDGNNLAGCVAIWDQRRFKQTVVHGYRFPLDRFRGIYNLFAGASGRNSLPAPGNRLEQVFLSFFALEHSAHCIAVDVMREGLALAAEKKAAVGVLGLSDLNPLCSLLKSALHQDCYRTCIETVTWPEQAEPLLDGRLVQPEVAVL